MMVMQANDFGLDSRLILDTVDMLGRSSSVQAKFDNATAAMLYNLDRFSRTFPDSEHIQDCFGNSNNDA